MSGEKLSKYKLKYKTNKRFAVKEAVFPFNKFPDSDLLLGPEMKSTGEVMGFDDDFGMAVAKSQIAASNSCLLYTSPSPRDVHLSRMPSSA